MITKKSTWKTGLFFWSFLILMFAFNFVHEFFNVSYFSFGLFLHIGIIIFSFLILLFSLNLNEKAAKYIIFGSILWIIVNSLLIFSRVFEEYSWLQTNLIIFLSMITGIFLIMFGFKEAVK